MLLSAAADAVFNLAASLSLAAVELGTIGVIVLILVLTAGLLLSLWALWVLLFVFGSR